jgi:hypothetical protein
MNTKSYLDDDDDDDEFRNLIGHTARAVVAPATG